MIVNEYIYTDRKKRELAYVRAVVDSYGRTSHFKYDSKEYMDLKSYKAALENEKNNAHFLLNYAGTMTAKKYADKHRRKK